MSTYLLTLIVGKFERYVLPKEKQAKCGVEVAGYAPHGNGEHWWGQMELAARCLDHYVEFFDTPYPLKKLDLICTY